MRYLLFSLLFLATNIWAQQSDDAFVNANSDHFIPGIIQLKVKNQYRDACSVNAIEVESLKTLFAELNYLEIKKMFPREQPPQQEFNDRGQKLADISLIYELFVPENTNIPDAVVKLSELNELEYAEPKFVSKDMYTPNDAGLTSVNPYHFITVDVYDAWDITQGDTNVVIGITDTAFDTDHEDMEGNVKYNYDDPVGNGDDDSDGYIDNFAGWDMVDDDNDLFIWNEIHGDAVAAIAGATGDNGIGYVGVGFKCKFLPVKVADNSQVVTKGYEGIQYCVNQGCSVVNCSWGNTTYSQTAQDIITWAAVNNDVVIVAAAGNITSTDYYYPASYNYVLSVTGVNANDVYDDGNLPPFVRNDSVDVSAPGYNVYTTATYNGGALYSPPQGGTSMASPIVAGVAGLVRSEFPCFSAAEVIAQIKATADNIDVISENVPYAGTLGTGRVNAEAAVTGAPCNPLGLNENGLPVAEMVIYPNPAKEHVIIKLNRAGAWNLHLLDASGKVVRQEQFNGNRTIVSGLATGFYLAQLSDGTTRLTQKLVITE